MGPYDQGDVKKKCLKQWKVRELVLLQKEKCYDTKIFHSFETPWKIVLRYKSTVFAHLLLLKRCFKTIKCLAMNATESLVATCRL